MRTLLLWLALLGTAWAQAPAWTVPQVRAELQRLYHVPSSAFSPTGLRLSELVRAQRLSYPQAVVTSGYYDLRGLSRYRSRPGLHLGYDVGMPRGASVRAAWPGRVLAITPWYGAEYGVTVSHPDGSQATYGHVAPLVKVGQEISAGQILATTEIDHVDVKMRDCAGAPLDFGDGPAPAPPPAARPLSQDELLARWVVYRGEWQSTVAELKSAGRSLADPKYRQAQLKTRIHNLEVKNRQMPEFLAQGLVARKDVEAVASQLASARREARMLASSLSGSARSSTTAPSLYSRGASRAGEGPARVRALDQARDAAARRLLQVRRQAAKRGLTWEQARALAERVATANPKLARSVASSQARAEDAGDLELSQQLSKATEQLKRLEELYAQGGISRAELDEARAEQHLLSAEQQVLRQLLK